MSKWKAFARNNRELFLSTDLPLEASEDQRAFDYFLMHGEHPRWTHFTLADLDAAQRDAIVELAARYIAEFDDPGLGMFSPQVHDEIKQRATARPRP